ncbi:glycosyltransferase [Nocardioidaceae bacterium]|nr:glycosyltransferase [Nocardioidaceae bacterium]
MPEAAGAGAVGATGATGVTPPALVTWSPRRLLAVRLLVLAVLTSGTAYVVWRWLFSVAWVNWWIAVPLILAETYSLVDAYLFGTCVWRARSREEPPAADPDATVDVFVCTYNEPIDLVMTTARAALEVRHPHRTWILDDGDRLELRAVAEAAGIGYLTRSADWRDRPRHAKAGNLNNALMATDAEFFMVLDADQVPDPAILERTLGYFRDPAVALVQTPQWFHNVPDSDPLGSQAPLFYGPIQQGKDGWNAAFFCGSNAVIRREALMQLGLVGYVRGVEHGVREALRASRRILSAATRRARREEPAVVPLLEQVRHAVTQARADLDAGAPLAEVTYAFQRTVDAVSRSMVEADVAAIEADLAALADLTDRSGTDADGSEAPPELGFDPAALALLASRDWSPLGAIASVKALVDAVDVDLGFEAQPLMPLATVSVTEDMATCMRLHGQGWRTVYHHEVLAQGLAPEDLRSMLQQRLRWAQGTVQVMLRENPLVQRGLTVVQRLMYFATMWSYLAGFAAVVYLVAPVLYLCFGVLPVQAYGGDFLAFFLPYILLNQLMFLVVGRGIPTWRGQQYSLALFPLWIRACATAAANVWFGKPLGFVVTPKTSPQGAQPFPWRLIWPQLLTMAVLVVAVLVGCVRLVAGGPNGVVGTGVNSLWVVYDLLMLSVIIEAARYRGPQQEPPAQPASTSTGLGAAEQMEEAVHG